MVLTFWVQIRVQIRPKNADFDLLKQKLKLFMKNSKLWLQTEWKSGLVWLSRPLYMVLAFWANFGPSMAKTSQIGQGIPPFYWPPKLYITIGIQKCPYFCWSIFFHFGLGQNLRGDLCKNWYRWANCIIGYFRPKLQKQSTKKLFGKSGPIFWPIQ